MTKLSLIVPTCNRDAARLDRLLTTMDWQFVPFHEVIVVDFSTDEKTQGANEGVCEYRARYLPCSLPTFNLSRVWNIGIRTASLGYIACTGVDFLFSPHFSGSLRSLMEGGVEFGRAQAALLPQGVDYGDLTLDNWPRLVSQGVRRHFLGHTISCAHRDWWYEVQGYDERMEGGLGVMDGDIRKRAQDYGLEIGYVKYETAPILHQWHPKSPLKHHNQPYREDHPPIVKNEGMEWGELP